MSIWIRRLVIIISMFLLYPSVFNLFVMFEQDIPKNIRQQIKAGQSTMIDLNKEITLEQDTITFNHLILSENETILVYEVHKEEQGWTFPNGALKLLDEQGNVYQYEGGSMSGKPWGEFDISYYAPLPKEIDTVVLDFEWYDRSFQVDLSLSQEER